MKLLLGLLLLLGFWQVPDLVQVRKLYSQAYGSEVQTRTLSSKLSTVNGEGNTLLVAYKGASLVLDSRYLKEPAEKMATLKEGIKLIEKAVKNDSNSVEVRFVRFTVQENVPPIVKYKMNLSGDKAFILSHFKNQQPALRDYFKQYLLTSKLLSGSEKESLR